jgi:hypothetical protein
VNGCDVEIGMNMAKEDSDIAEADDPFGMLQQEEKFNPSIM